MSYKTISVIMPNYNHGHYMAESIDTILSQSPEPTEVIVIDDASTDDSVEVIQRLVSGHSAVKLFRNEVNMGPIVSTNRALKLATGEYVYAMAADDKIMPTFFEKSFELLEEYPHAGLCSADMVYIDDRGDITGECKAAAFTQASFLSPAEVLTELYKNPNYIIGGTTIFRRSALVEAGGFPPQLLSLCDWFAERAIALKYGACYIPEALFLWRQTGNNYSNSTFTNVPKMLGVVDCAIKLMRTPPYSELFPLDFIHYWHKWFVEQIKSSMIGRLEQQQSAFLEELQKCVNREKMSERLFFGLIYRLARAQLLLSKTYIERRYFPRHMGDVQRECEKL